MTSNKTVKELRYNEHTNFQPILDNLYKDSRLNVIHDNLMPLILDPRNILLAIKRIRNSGHIFKNNGIKDILELPLDDIVQKLKQMLYKTTDNGYQPAYTTERYIERYGQLGEYKPIADSDIWDQLIQQCIYQILDPICEAKFSGNSYGFRIGRNAAHAVAKLDFNLQNAQLPYIIELPIYDFFKTVNHRKLRKQIWALGIHDKHLIYIISRILKTPLMIKSQLHRSTKGIVQCGRLLPLLTNIVLNELDQWIDTQWQEYPNFGTISIRYCPNGSINHDCQHKAMTRDTTLKLMYIVRYEDQIRISCRNKKEAEKILSAITLWLNDRLKLSVDKQNCKIIDCRRNYTNYLGFKRKLRKKFKKGNKVQWVVKSHVSDNVLDIFQHRLKEQLKHIQYPNRGFTLYHEIQLYNYMILRFHTYYNICSSIWHDCNHIKEAMFKSIYNRLHKNRLTNKRCTLTSFERQIYKDHIHEFKYVNCGRNNIAPLYPIIGVAFRVPKCPSFKQCPYTVEGRSKIHSVLKVDRTILNELYKLTVKSTD